MMLDKGQIKDWDGEPEEADASKAKPAAKPIATAAPARSSGEALPTGERVQLTPEQAGARKRRGQWIAIALFAFVILLFTLTMTKIGGNIVNWGGAFESEKGQPIE
jgi:hypothetical protein